MEHLPLLIRYGTSVWIAALSAMVLAAVLGDRHRRRRAARKEASVRRAGLLDPIRRLDGAEGTLVTLQGRIVASGVQARRFEDGAEVAAASAGSRHADAVVGTRAQRLELVTSGVVVRLDGLVEVIVGDIETHTGRAPDRLGAPLRRRIEDAGGLWDSAEPVVLRSVRSSAAVRVRGELRRGDAGDGLLSYRSGGGTLRLAPPAGEVGAGLRLAYEEVPLLGEGRLRAPLQAAFGALLVFAAVFVGAPELQGRGAIHGEVLAQVLAATPLHRARAVTAYADILDAGLRRRPLDAGRLDRLYGVGTLQGRCDRAVQALLDHGQWVRAEAEARRCDLPLLAARAAYGRGDFAGAASTWETGSAGVRDGIELLFA
jgi:hypothetical protein